MTPLDMRTSLGIFRKRNVLGRLFSGRKSYQKLALSIPGRDNIPLFVKLEDFCCA